MSKAAILMSVVVAICVSDARAHAQAVTLRYTFRPGQRLTVSYEEANASSSDNLVTRTRSQKSSSQRCSQLWVVRSVNAAGDATIESKFTTVVMRQSVESSDEFVFDMHRSVFETNPSLTNASASERAELQKVDEFRKWTAEVFLNRTLTFVVSNTGHVKSVIGFGDAAWDLWRQKVGVIIPDKEKRAQLDAQVESVYGDESVARVLSLVYFIDLPTATVTIGQEWSDATEFVSGSFRLPMKRHYKLARATDNGRVSITETTVYDPPVVPPELSVRQNENLMTAEIVIDPAEGVISKRSYNGLSDSDIYRQRPVPATKVMHSVVSVKGVVTIANEGMTRPQSNATNTSRASQQPATPTDGQRRGAEYTATVLWSGASGTSLRARIYVRGALSRLDPAADPSSEPMYLLVDKDTQTIAAVFPNRRAYMRESLQTGTGPWADFYRKQGVVFNTGEPCAVAFQGAADCKYIGEQTLSGRTVNTWEAIRGVDGRILTGHVWVDSRLGVILKTETPGGVIELQGIDESPQPTERFAIPGNYVQQKK
ncbi:MAG: DUF6263 family protein [Vicinamibacterales bacterium]